MIDHIVLDYVFVVVCGGEGVGGGRGVAGFRQYCETIDQM